MPNDAALFAVEEARFMANGRILLGPLSLAVPSGAFIGLIGHNGSGKSTLLKMLARQQPGEGGIRLNGRPLAQWGERAFAREVAYLPQTTPTGLRIPSMNPSVKLWLSSCGQPRLTYCHSIAQSDEKRATRCHYHAGGSHHLRAMHTGTPSCGS